MITQRIDDVAHESMNEGRGLCRVLAVGVAFGALLPPVLGATAVFSQRSEQCNGTGGF